MGESGQKMRLLVKGAKQIVCVAANKELVKTGPAMHDLAILETEEGEERLSIAVDSDGNIAAVDEDSVVASMFPDAEWECVIDAHGHAIVPGLVDAHSHPVWAGDRVHEFAMKLAGASYMDVHNAGGGIHFTVERTKKATEKQLLKLLQERLERMSKQGTTLVECKSGYGLDVETELKMLRVIEKARQNAPLEISSTFCGAHAVPLYKTSEEATRDVIEQQIPALKQAMDANEIKVDNIDVFCERGVFDVQQARRILEAGRKVMGLMLNFHADELSVQGAAEMGAELNAEAMSHLEEISLRGIDAMAQSGSVGILLPTTAFILRLHPPPARDMINRGAAVALGSDFNPNAFCFSMPVVMHLACVLMKLSLNEALTASTLNAARALRKSHLCGSIEVGKQANLLLLNFSRWEHLVYQFAAVEDVINHVVYKGRVVHSRV